VAAYRGIARYHLCAGEHLVRAWSLAELAELIDCAVDAGDPLIWLRAADGQVLADEEFGAVLEHLAACAQPGGRRR
jgi:hypothetical protein